VDGETNLPGGRKRDDLREITGLYRGDARLTSHQQGGLARRDCLSGSRHCAQARRQGEIEPRHHGGMRSQGLPPHAFGSM
jgi:hypothetical protein